MLKRFLEDRSGATAIEYSIIATIISLAIVVGVLAVSGQISQLYSDIAIEVTQ
jgi:pilus assembly protein Flp/PilA